MRFHARPTRRGKRRKRRLPQADPSIIWWYGMVRPHAYRLTFEQRLHILQQ